MHTVTTGRRKMSNFKFKTSLGISHNPLPEKYDFVSFEHRINNKEPYIQVNHCDPVIYSGDCAAHWLG